MRGKRWYVPTLLATVLVASLVGSTASAHLRKQNGDRVSKRHARWHKQQQTQTAATTGTSAQSVPTTAAEFDDWGPSLPMHQHGPMTGHLPPVQENVELLGKLKLTNFADDVSDVSALGNFAYVGDWGLGGQCSTGGVNIVDISDPTNPVKVKFLNAGGSGYQTEGIQALHISTSAYTGDILIVSNEWCRTMPNVKQMPGGISIWDINDPTSPRELVHAFGDFDDHAPRANEAHSVIAWDAGNNAYAAAIDNEAVEDVDIFDITDPRNPQLIFETALAGVNVDAHGEFQTSHDFDVLQFNNDADAALEWNLMVSDWDAGWVHLDVTDPHARAGRAGGVHDGRRRRRSGDDPAGQAAQRAGGLRRVRVPRHIDAHPVGRFRDPAQHPAGRRGADHRPPAGADERPQQPRAGLLPGGEGRQRHGPGVGCGDPDRPPPRRRCGGR